MKLIKFSLTGFLAVLVVASFSLAPTKIFAEETNPENFKVYTIAHVDVQKVEVVSQEGNNLNFSFNIINREKSQSGIKYGVQLVDSEGQIIDEYIYDDILNLEEGDSLDKNISYSAPVGIKEGLYYLNLVTKNNSGLSLGEYYIGEAEFTQQLIPVEILKDTCSVEITGGETEKIGDTQLVLNEGEVLSFNCIIKNHTEEEISVSPVVETYISSLYGEKTSKTLEEINLRPLEDKIVRLEIPQTEIPQTYVSKVFLQNNKIKSNSMTIDYMVKGLSANITNVSLDKSSYQSGEIAQIALYWNTTASSREELISLSYEIDIVNKSGNSCLKEPIVEQVTKDGYLEIPAMIDRTCRDPQVSVSIYDINGKVLDQRDLNFTSDQKSDFFTGQSGIILVIVLALLIAISLIVYGRKQKKGRGDKGDRDSSSGEVFKKTLALLFFIFAVTLIPGGVAKADKVTLFEFSINEGSAPYAYTKINVLLNSSFTPYESPLGGQVTHTLEGKAYHASDSQPPEPNLEYRVCFNGLRLDDNLLLSGGNDCLIVWYHAFIALQNLGSVSFTNQSTNPQNNFWGLGSLVIKDPNGDIIYTYPNFLYDAGGYITLNANTAQVTVYAENANTGERSSGGGGFIPVPNELTITAGTPVKIIWKVDDAPANAKYKCTFPGGGNCGESTGPTLEYWNGTKYYPITTTVYTVSPK